MNENAALHLASDVRGAVEAVAGSSYDIIVTLRVRPGLEPVYEMRKVKKRRPRRKKEVDGRQAEMF